MLTRYTRGVVQALCHVLQREGNSRDLLSMLTRYTRGSTSTLPCFTEERESQGPSLYANQVYSMFYNEKGNHVY